MSAVGNVAWRDRISGGTWPVWIRRAVFEYRLVSAVFVVSLVVRLALLPITYGQDFVVWDKASLAILHGTNFYAHHPNYPGGPYAYLPTFLYVEVPARWLAAHGVASFVVLGKLPIVAADIALAALLARVVRRRGASERRVALGAGLFLLNPLVLYNGAFYGRFDSICVALMAAALIGRPSGAQVGRRTAALYAAAVAMKTFPIVVLPGLLRQVTTGRRRLMVILVGGLGLLSLPYSILSPFAMFRDIVLWDTSKDPSGLSWQRAVLDVTGATPARLISLTLLMILGVVLVRLRRIDDFETYCLVAIIAFLLLSKVVLEQYLLWPMPWLILRATVNRSIPALLTLGFLSVVGMIANPYIHPFGQQTAWIGVALATVLASYALYVVQQQRPTLAACR